MRGRTAATMFSLQVVREIHMYTLYHLSYALDVNQMCWYCENGVNPFALLQFLLRKVWKDIACLSFVDRDLIRGTASTVGYTFSPASDYSSISIWLGIHDEHAPCGNMFINIANWYHHELGWLGWFCPRLPEKNHMGVHGIIWTRVFFLT